MQKYKIACIRIEIPLVYMLPNSMKLVLAGSWNSNPGDRRMNSPTATTTGPQSVKFVKKRGAEEKAAAPESKKPRSAACRAASTPDLRLTAPTPADSPTTIAGSSREQEKVAGAAVITGGDASLAGTPVHLEDLRFPEGVGMVMSRIREGLRWFETGAEQLRARHEDELNRYSDQLAAAKAKLGKANTEVKALKADLTAERARAAEEAEEAGRLRAELKAAKGGLRAAKDGQGEVLRAYTKRLLLSDQFSELARDLAELINGNAAVEVIEEVAKDYPGLDASKYGYQKLEGAAVYTQFAKVVRRHLDRLPLLNELVSSPALLTAEVIASCSTDRDAELDAAFDALSEEDVEMEQVGAGDEEERAEKEPSSSRGADSPKVAEIGGAGEGASAGEQLLPEKEVGET